MALNYFSVERLRRSERDQESSDEYDTEGDDEQEDGQQRNGHARAATERSALLAADAEENAEWTNRNGTMKRWHVPSD